MICLDLGDWKETTGWCVNATGEEDGRSENRKGFTEKTCFELCKKSSNFNGCTFDTIDNSGICITYSGDIVGGNDFVKLRLISLLISRYNI